jgi:hypothetical protein
VPGRTPPSRALLVLLALGTIGLGVAAVYVFLSGRGRHADRDPALALPATPHDALPTTPDAAPSTSSSAVPGEPADAAIADAAGASDAGVAGIPAPTDAGPRATRPGPATLAPDAGAAGALPAPPRPAGEATLVIGANPWGDIYVDGARKGRTPTTLVVPAGKHAVDVVFGGEDPPRTKRFSVDLRGGETQQLDADFTKP